LNYGIDFAGGTEFQVKFAGNVTSSELRNFMEKEGYTGVHVQAFGDGKEFLLRVQGKQDLKVADQNRANKMIIEHFTTELKKQFGDKGPDLRRVDSVGPQVGDQLKKNSILAVFYSLLLILIYVGLRFDYEFAPGAVFSLFHDVVITLGIFSFLGREINVQILAAVLTIIGLSLNDTIINFDRIRENRDKVKNANLKEIINLSINEVLSRTILTTCTVMLAIMALYFFAGGVITDFAFVLGIGMIFGTYSSIYIAAPMALFLEKFRKA
jgi:preprotein translocase subunit SecF